MFSVALLLRSWVATCAILLIAGCTMTDRDVSHDEHFLVGYRPGEIYRLKQPFSLIQLDDGAFELLPPGAVRNYGKPAGMLATGTQIKIISLRHIVLAAPVQWETSVKTAAQIVDQPDRTIRLDEVSGVRWIDGDHGMKTPVLLPDRKWLELVTPARSSTSTQSALDSILDRARNR